MQLIRKLLGSDIELGNFIQGVTRSGGSGRQASRLLVSKIPGVSSAFDRFDYGYMSPYAEAAGFGLGAAHEPLNPRDVGRRWGSSGSCVYIDSDHAEICTPECLSAFDWAAAYYALLENIREAQELVARQLPDGQHIRVYVGNSDGLGNSFGSHMNVLISRAAFTNIFHRRMQYLVWLAGYLTSSVIVTGLGKVGAEHGRAVAAYQISQRADFFEEMFSENTMFKRPILNTRDEAHTGLLATDMARFHVICADANLCPVANVLKAGLLQIMLAIVEAESPLIKSSTLLESPVDAFLTFSRDLSLSAKVRTIDGEMVSSLDLQRRYFDAAQTFVQSGACEGIVPRAAEILALWSDVLDGLEARDWDMLSTRLDWVLKKRLIECSFDSNPQMSWESEDAKYLDLMYGSLDEDGLFWPLLNSGHVHQIVDPSRIEHLRHSPPSDTRAFTRGHIIRGAGAHYQIDSVDWGQVKLRVPGSGEGWRRFYGRSLTVYLDSPFGSTAEDNPRLATNGDLPLKDIPVDVRPADKPTTKETLSWNCKSVHTKHLLKARK